MSRFPRRRFLSYFQKIFVNEQFYVFLISSGIERESEYHKFPSNSFASVPEIF